MTRTLPALLALAAGAATLTVASPTPAQADGGTYDDLTSITFSDVAGDAPPSVDVRSGAADVDPNASYFYSWTDFAADSAQPSFVVVRLGEVVAGSCEIRLEAVSNRAGYQVLRAPGETTLPPYDDMSGYDQDAMSMTDARFDGLVPTCAVLDLIDKAGTVLDHVDGVVTHTSAGRGTLGISRDPDAILNADPGETTRLDYWVSAVGDAVYDVTVDAVPGDPGLVLPTTHFELGDLLHLPYLIRRRLTFTATPGMHTLTLRLTGGNAATSETTVTIWGRGGPTLARGESLVGRTFFLEQDDIETHFFVHWRRWVAYSFQDDTWVRRSNRDTLEPTQPAPYLPCTRVTPTCLRYAYDAETGAVQVGRDRGELRDGVLRLNDVQDHAARAAGAGTTVAFVGRNRNVTPRWKKGKAEFLLTLRRNGTFVRTTQLYDLQKHPTIQRGRYRVGPDGLLVARTASGKVLRTGLAFVLDAQGRPRPQKLGVYAFDVWFHPKKR